jgi:hypothetical protein
MAQPTFPQLREYALLLAGDETEMTRAVSQLIRDCGDDLDELVAARRSLTRGASSDSVSPVAAALAVRYLDRIINDRLWQPPNSHQDELT